MNDTTQEMVDAGTGPGEDSRASYVQVEPAPWKKYREYTIKLTLPFNAKLDTEKLGMRFLRSGAEAVEFKEEVIEPNTWRNVTITTIPQSSTCECE